MPRADLDLDEDEEYGDFDPDAVLVPSYVVYFDTAIAQKLLTSANYTGEPRQEQERLLSLDEAEDAISDIISAVDSAVEQVFTEETPAPNDVLSQAMAGALAWIEAVLRVLHPADAHTQSRVKAREQAVAEQILGEHRKAVTEWGTALRDAAKIELEQARFALNLGYVHRQAEAAEALKEFLRLVYDPAAVWDNNEAPTTSRWFTVNEVNDMQERARRQLYPEFRYLAELLVERGGEDLIAQEPTLPDTRTLPLFPERKP
jgi:hypothetical protein